MSTRRALSVRLAASGVAALLLVSCGSESEVNTSTSSMTADTAASTSTTMPEPDSVDFDLVVGENTGRDTMVEVRAGATVTLRVTSAEPIDEVHIHGYDLYLEDLAAGTAASITFVANVEGEFEVERHDTSEVLMVLRVT